MAKACSFLSVENDDVQCVIFYHELRKKENVQNLSSEGLENFVLISKSWANVKIPINDKYSSIRKNS